MAENMITAQEARELSGPSSHDYALFFKEKIKEAAKKGERKIVQFHGQLENEAYSNSQKWKDFAVYMLKLGYAVSLHYEERQFVDMRIVISWE